MANIASWCVVGSLSVRHPRRFPLTPLHRCILITPSLPSPHPLPPRPSCCPTVATVALFVVCKVFKIIPGKEALVIYPVVSSLSVTRCVWLALAAVQDGTFMELSASRESRMYGSHAGFLVLAQTTFAYEIWNTLAAFVLPDYRTPQFIGHHVFTGTLAKLSQQPYLGFYGLFFFGLASISTVSLNFVDLFRYGPPSLAQNLPAVNSFFRALFGIKFILIRVFSWPLISVLFLMDVGGVIIEGGDGKQRPWVAALFLVSNVGLTTLQFTWAGAIMKQLTGDKKPGDVKKN